MPISQGYGLQTEQESCAFVVMEPKAKKAKIKNVTFFI
jgi:hypothetical protein